MKARDSKFGVAMVLETTEQSGSFLLGFRIDPYERLKEIMQEIQSLYQVRGSSLIVQWKSFTCMEIWFDQ